MSTPKERGHPRADILALGWQFETLGYYWMQHPGVGDTFIETVMFPPDDFSDDWRFTMVRGTQLQEPLRFPDPFTAHVWLHLTP